MSDTERDLEPAVKADDDAVSEAGDKPTPSRRRRPDSGVLVACFVIACGVALIAWGMTSAITGTDGVDRPDAIEELSPVENAQQVFQQEQILVDLEFGYEAALVIDGIELPTERIGEFSGDLTPETAGQQISTPPTAVFDPGNSVITFRPTDGALIESFSEGRHQAQVIFWKTEDGRDAARSYRWSFEVV